MFTRAFIKATLERAIRTVAQSAAALLGAVGLGLFDVDWVDVASVAGMAGILSILTSIAGGAAPGDGPSLLNDERLNTEGDISDE